MPWKKNGSDRVVLMGSIFTGFGVAHLIDDFLFGVPADFNLANSTAQWLGLGFFGALAGLIALAARGSRQSYHGLILIGLLLALADTLAHLPEILSGPYRSGLASILFSTGLILSGILLAFTALWALRKDQELPRVS